MDSVSVNQGTAMNKDEKITDTQRLSLKTYAKIMRAVSNVTANMHRHLAHYKLTVSQFGVLEAIYHLGPLCQLEIGQKILKTGGNMTMVIDNLEKRGLVARVTDPSDRRYTRVGLTEDGDRLIRKLFPRHAEITAQVFSVLETKELNELGSLMKKLGTANTIN
jgi:MarR family 2-MHQ and catechol resistance regulon transcriptional repressor